MKNNRMFDTRVVNLKNIKNKGFNIPTYQRPYVWRDVEVKKLIDDFYKQFDEDMNKPYYIGTILTKAVNNYDDLIDGQQRFTTLWLIALVFKKLGIECDLVDFLEVDKKLRLGFEIRKEVEVYLNQLLGKTEVLSDLKIQSSDIEKYPYLINIANALTTIEGIFNEEGYKNKLSEFGNYIYSKVYMIKNEAPENINLNKLFETINSAGVQLEQTDIIKSNLLRVIGNKKVLFSKIWESCQNMNNFFERNIRQSFPTSEWKEMDLSSYIEFDEHIFKYGDTEVLGSEGELFKIEDILLSNIERYHKYENRNDTEDRRSEEVYCRSIINFGQLLLHTYRIHLKREGKKDFKGMFHTNRLIEIFTEFENRNDKNEVKRFFLLLWDVRYMFDKYIIKWISDVDEKKEHLELANINKTEKNYYSRTNYSKTNSLMLQSVMYFTGDYLRQYWITTFLVFLINNKNKNLSPTSEDVLAELERIDNGFSLNNSLTDKEASLTLIDSNIEKNINIEKYLKSNKGTSFMHYWFQKLEYVLWKNWRNIDDVKYKQFRITSKNSVEHIYPQQPKYSEFIDKKNLDSFGNLVLLSVSQNSEYSNKEVGVKKAEFKNKQTYDSLKSYFIFASDEEWEPNAMHKHQEEMILVLKNFYNQEDNNV